MRATPATAAKIEPVDPAEIARLTRARLKELDRLRDVAFLHVEKLAEACAALPKEQVFKAMLANAGCQVMDFDRLCRAIRQITVLEFELRGLFQAPNRDAPRKLKLVKSDRPGFQPPDLEKLRVGPVGLDLKGLGLDSDYLDIRSDYRTGPLDQVVAGIRKTIGVPAPENDPFAPPEYRHPPAKLPPATVKLPEKPPAPDMFSAHCDAAVKAAKIAIMAKGCDGFRKPSKKQLAKARLARQRGPPR